MIALLRRGRASYEEFLSARGAAHTLSLARFGLHRGLVSAIRQHARGTCLDAGAGRSPYRELLEAQGCCVRALDIEHRGEPLDFVGDVQDMPDVRDESVQTVICTQVLEHVPRPWDAMTEFARVLEPGGALILSAPHLSVLHEVPHDYYRYTHYGLEALCQAAGLQPIRIRATSGLLAFLGHGASGLLAATVGAVPGLRWLGWLVNYLLLVRGLDVVDRLLGLRGLYPCDHVLIALKPPRSTAAS